MKLYRYMSVDEAIALFIDKQTLTNTTDHHHRATTSRGFCFGIGDRKRAIQDYRRLAGIVTPTILIIFHPTDLSRFTPSQGRYCDYEALDRIYPDELSCPLGQEPTRLYNEYSTTTYSYRDINPSTLQIYHITGFTHITAEPLPNPLLPQPR